MHSLAIKSEPPALMNALPAVSKLVPLSIVGSALIAISKPLKDGEFATFTAIGRLLPM